jgi:hypothetical protein
MHRIKKGIGSEQILTGPRYCKWDIMEYHQMSMSYSMNIHEPLHSWANLSGQSILEGVFPRVFEPCSGKGSVKT